MRVRDCFLPGRNAKKLIKAAVTHENPCGQDHSPTNPRENESACAREDMYLHATQNVQNGHYSRVEQLHFVHFIAYYQHCAADSRGEYTAM